MDKGGSELLVEGSCDRLPTEVSFPSKVIEVFGGWIWPLTTACAEEISSALGWWCGQRIPEGFFTGLALPGENDAGCPGTAAEWHGRVGCQGGADLSLR